MKSPAGRRRRPSPQAADARDTMPAWKRWLGAVLFTVGGGLCAAWGIHDIAAWIGSLYRGDRMIETESMILGLPFLGGGLCAIGPTFLIPRSVALSDRLSARLAGVMLGLIIAGIVLTPLGALAINVTMASKGYHTCAVYGRGRFTAVTWAGTEEACPAH